MKERMLRAARGQWADWLLWAPRIDLWYNANRYRGTLPAVFRKDASLDEVADYIGGGYHKVVPEFLRARTPEDTIDRGIGIYRLREMACRPELVGVDREVKHQGDATTVTYHTPVDSVSCRMLYTEEMIESSMSHDEFETYMTALFQDISPGDRFILSVSDTTPPDAKFERLLRITEMVREQGQLPMKSYQRKIEA